MLKKILLCVFIFFSSIVQADVDADYYKVVEDYFYPGLTNELKPDNSDYFKPTKNLSRFAGHEPKLVLSTLD